MSLGGDALMTVRMKRKHYVGKEIDWRNYDSSKKVLAGCQMEKELLELQKMCQDGESPEEIQQAKEKIQVKAKAQRTRTAPPCLTMLIKHGDMVVMHGPALQSIYEVCFEFDHWDILSLLIGHSIQSFRKINCDSL